MSKKERKGILAVEDRNTICEAFKRVTSENQKDSEAARAEIAEAITLPLRQTLLSGENRDNIFEPLDFTTNPHVEFPLDLLTPGQEREFYAYVIPAEGRIPERRVEADYLMVPTYDIGNGIDCTLRFIRNANWPVIQRMMEILEAGFVKKMNDDGWQTLLTAATDRNIVVNDPNAAAGQFTPRLVTLLSTFMRRNGGGNSATLNRAKLTDMYVSPEALMDIRAWTLDIVPDEYRAKIFNQGETDPDSMNLWGVNLHAMDEFGEGQEYQTYFTTTLGGTMASADVEIVVGLDRQRNDSFINPVRDPLKIFEDNTTFRRGIFSLFGRTEIGFAVLDSRRTLLGSL